MFFCIELNSTEFCKEVTLTKLVKASVCQADVQRFEPHLRHNLLSSVCFF